MSAPDREAARREKPRIREVIVVEGRYDKNALMQLVEATVLCTDGFQIFRDREKQALLRTLAEERGLIILTDADGAGQLIRGFLSGLADPSRIKHAYIPEIPGKERRKNAPSREGTLGVEGMTPELLLRALRRAGATELSPPSAVSGGITKASLYRLGLSGGPGSGKKRLRLQKALGLPSKLSANQLLQVLNALTTEAELQSLLKTVPEESQPHSPQEQDTGREFQEGHGQPPILRAVAEKEIGQRKPQQGGGESQDIL